MKLSELKGVLSSGVGMVQKTIVVEYAKDKPYFILEDWCSVEFAVANYAGREVIGINAIEDKLIIKLEAQA